MTIVLYLNFLGLYILNFDLAVMLEFFSNLFGHSDWPARWFCGKWTEFHGWLYILSDLTIWLAYFAIPIILILFIQRKNDVPFLPIFWLFGAFIILCGMTHLIDAVIFWLPIYRVSALVKFITAVVSMITVYALIKQLPKALNLKSPDELVKEVQKAQKAEEDLRRKNEELNKMVVLMSGREKKMKEMKAEIERLKKARN